MSCIHDKGDRWYRKTNMFNESFCLKMDEISSCPFCEEDEDIKKEDSVMSKIRELKTNLDIALKAGEAYKKEALKLREGELIKENEGLKEDLSKLKVALGRMREAVLKLAQCGMCGGSGYVQTSDDRGNPETYKCYCLDLKEAMAEETAESAWREWKEKGTRIKSLEAVVEAARTIVDRSDDRKLEKALNNLDNGNGSV